MKRTFLMPLLLVFFVLFSSLPVQQANGQTPPQPPLSDHLSWISQHWPFVTGGTVAAVALGAGVYFALGRSKSADEEREFMNKYEKLLGRMVEFIRYEATISGEKLDEEHFNLPAKREAMLQLFKQNDADGKKGMHKVIDAYLNVSEKNTAFLCHKMQITEYIVNGNFVSLPPIFQGALQCYLKLHNKLVEMEGLPKEWQHCLLNALETQCKGIYSGWKIIKKNSPNWLSDPEDPEAKEFFTYFSKIVRGYINIFSSDEALLKIIINTLATFQQPPSYPLNTLQYDDIIARLLKCTDEQLDRLENQIKTLPHLSNRNFRIPPSDNNIFLHVLYEARQLPLLFVEEQGNNDINKLIDETVFDQYGVKSRLAIARRFHYHVFDKKHSDDYDQYIQLEKTKLKQNERDLLRLAQEIKFLHTFSVLRSDYGLLFDNDFIKEVQEMVNAVQSPNGAEKNTILQRTAPQMNA